MLRGRAQEPVRCNELGGTETDPCLCGAGVRLVTDRMSGCERLVWRDSELGLQTMSREKCDRGFGKPDESFRTP